MCWTPKFTEETHFTFEYQTTNPDFKDDKTPPDEPEMVEASHDIPLRFEMCSVCQGRGQSSAYLGAITEEDRERDWSEDEFDSYCSGGYDRTCETCKGNRVVKVIDDLKSLPLEVRKAYNQSVREEREYQSMCRMEREYGC